MNTKYWQQRHVQQAPFCVSPGRKNGFSLPELIVVLAIMAIFSVYAVSGYHRMMARGYRMAAGTALYRAAQAIEQNRLNDNDPATGPALSLPAGFDQSPPDGKAVYRLHLYTGNKTNGGYTIAAVPVASGPMFDDPCGSYLLDATGRRSNKLGHASAPLTAEQCWQFK
jgi:type IV pilus assembly protein PilE